MKKNIMIFTCFLLMLLTVGCNISIRKEEIYYGTSSIYTKKDMNEAIEVIKNEIQLMDGVELHSLSYSSDDICNDEENLIWMNKLESANDNKQIFTQCIMFNSSFHSPKKAYGSWEPDKEYHWSWWLARSDGGKWKLMTFGY